MKLTPLIILFFLSFFEAVAQGDTVFFNINWEITTEENAAFFRPQPVKEGERYKFADYYINGQLQNIGYSLRRDTIIRDGYAIYYDSLGRTVSEGNYVADSNDGVWKFYYGGVLWYTFTFKNGKRDGEFKSYYPSGRLKRETVFIAEKEQQGKMYDSTGVEIPYSVFFYEPPSHKGISKYIINVLVYPNKAKAEKIEGEVTVKFCINERGKAACVQIVKSPHEWLSIAVKKAMKHLPRFEPATQDGMPVKIFYTQPVTFRL